MRTTITAILLCLVVSKCGGLRTPHESPITPVDPPSNEREQSHSSSEETYLSARHSIGLPPTEREQSLSSSEETYLTARHSTGLSPTEREQSLSSSEETYLTARHPTGLPPTESEPSHSSSEETYLTASQPTGLPSTESEQLYSFEETYLTASQPTGLPPAGSEPSILPATGTEPYTSSTSSESYIPPPTGSETDTPPTASEPDVPPPTESELTTSHATGREPPLSPPTANYHYLPPHPSESFLSGRKQPPFLSTKVPASTTSHPPSATPPYGYAHEWNNFWNIYDSDNRHHARNRHNSWNRYHPRNAYVPFVDHFSSDFKPRPNRRLFQGFDTGTTPRHRPGFFPGIVPSATGSKQPPERTSFTASHATRLPLTKNEPTPPLPISMKPPSPPPTASDHHIPLQTNEVFYIESEPLPFPTTQMHPPTIGHRPSPTPFQHSAHGWNHSWNKNDPWNKYHPRNTHHFGNRGYPQNRHHPRNRHHP